MEKRKVQEDAELEEKKELTVSEDCEELIVGEEVDVLNDMVPQMNVNMPDCAEGDENALISDEALVGIYKEILDGIKEDRDEISDYIVNLADLVFNDGDATTASKEALVNLMKAKSDLSDKKIKIADLMTRIKLKARDTFPRYMANHQNNTVNFGDTGRMRELIENISKKKKK